MYPRIVFAVALAPPLGVGGYRRTDTPSHHPAVHRQLLCLLPKPAQCNHNGSSCGRRSAYSRQGGASPMATLLTCRRHWLMNTSVVDGKS